MQMEDTYPICQLSFLSLVLMREEPWFAVCLINVQSHVFITSSSNTDSQNNGMLIIMANSRIKDLTLQKIDLRLLAILCQFNGPTLFMKFIALLYCTMNEIFDTLQLHSSNDECL